MARLAGLEPATYGLEGCCSIRLSYRRKTRTTHVFSSYCKIGRGREIRTPDILHPKQARYQTALYPDTSTSQSVIFLPLQQSANNTHLTYLRQGLIRRVIYIVEHLVPMRKSPFFKLRNCYDSQDY